jgi:hypothetical protein
MSTEHDEQPTELTYPTNDEQPTELTTIRLVLASDDSDKENHIPDIRRDEITVKLEQPTTESLRGNSVEGTGGSTAINRSDPLCQDLPRSVTPNTGTNGAETTRIMASIPDVLRDEIDRQPLRPIPLRQTQTRNQSFSNLRSGQEIHDRINYIAAFAGLTIAHDDQHRLARLWSLLKDDRFAVAVTQRARGLFNWQCADLIEIFINIAKLEWNEPLCPGTSIEQFGLDLLRRILAADVERLYDAAIDDVRANQYGVIPKNEKRFSSSSARNEDRSGSSRASSTWSTPTTKNSSSGMKTHRSHETKTGEPSHGDPSRNGKTHRRHHRLKSNHHSKTGSSVPHNNHPHHYNPRADETDYDDYETPEIGDIHGDEVYNNID